jgi:hypothetical protein
VDGSWHGRFDDDIPIASIATVRTVIDDVGRRGLGAYLVRVAAWHVGWVFLCLPLILALGLILGGIDGFNSVLAGIATAYVVIPVLTLVALPVSLVIAVIDYFVPGRGVVRAGGTVAFSAAAWMAAEPLLLRPQTSNQGSLISLLITVGIAGALFGVGLVLLARRM